MTASTAILFGTPDDVYAAVTAEVSRQGWPLTTDELNTLYGQMPSGFRSDLSHALGLDIWLGSLEQSVTALFVWNRRIHGYVDEPPDELPTDGACMRLVHPERYGPNPSIRWVVLDLLANKGQQARAIHPQEAAGLSVLAITAAHPEWVVAMGSESIPKTAMPGIIVSTEGEPDRVPVVAWDWRGNRLVVSQLMRSYPHRAYAQPTYQDVNTLPVGRKSTCPT